jgi:hypothetical protein
MLHTIKDVVNIGVPPLMVNQVLTACHRTTVCHCCESLLHNNRPISLLKMTLIRGDLQNYP